METILSLPMMLLLMFLASCQQSTALLVLGSEFLEDIPTQQSENLLASASTKISHTHGQMIRTTRQDIRSALVNKQSAHDVETDQQKTDRKIVMKVSGGDDMVKTERDDSSNISKQNLKSAAETEAMIVVKTKGHMRRAARDTSSASWRRWLQNQRERKRRLQYHRFRRLRQQRLAATKSKKASSHHAGDKVKSSQPGDRKLESHDIQSHTQRIKGSRDNFKESFAAIKVHKKASNGKASKTPQADKDARKFNSQHISTHQQKQRETSTVSSVLQIRETSVKGRLAGRDHDKAEISSSKTKEQRLTRLRQIRQNFLQRKRAKEAKAKVVPETERGMVKAKTHPLLELEKQQEYSQHFADNEYQRANLVKHELSGEHYLLQDTYKGIKKELQYSVRPQRITKNDDQQQPQQQRTQTQIPKQNTVVESTTQRVSAEPPTMVSEMTSLFPFIETTTALDYLSSYEDRPRPRRWPIKLILENKKKSNQNAPQARIRTKTQEETITVTPSNKGSEHTTIISEPVIPSSKILTASNGDDNGFDISNTISKYILESSGSGENKRPQISVSTSKKQTIHARQTKPRENMQAVKNRDQQSQGLLKPEHDEQGGLRKNNDNGENKTLDSSTTNIGSHSASSSSLGVTEKMSEGNKETFLDNFDGSGDSQSGESERAQINPTVASKSHRVKKNRHRMRKFKSGKGQRRAERRKARKRRRRLERLRKKMLKQNERHKRKKNRWNRFKAKERRLKTTTDLPRPNVATLPAGSLTKVTIAPWANSSLYVQKLSSVTYNPSNAYFQPQTRTQTTVNSIAWKTNTHSNSIDSKSSPTLSSRYTDGLDRANANISRHTQNAHSELGILNISSSKKISPEHNTSSTSQDSSMNNSQSGSEAVKISVPSQVVNNFSNSSKLPLISTPMATFSFNTTPLTLSVTNLFTQQWLSGSSPSLRKYIRFDFVSEQPGDQGQNSHSTPTSENEISTASPTTATISEWEQWKNSRRKNQGDRQEGSFGLHSRSIHEKGSEEDQTPQPDCNGEKKDPFIGNKTVDDFLSNQKNYRSKVQRQKIIHKKGNGEGKTSQSGRIGEKKEPFIGYKTAYDFLSSQKVYRPKVKSENQRESDEYFRSTSEGVCEIFNKHFVSTMIGGKCV
ncbi:hypothetical protein PoB_006121700 [Plakobranchus ocellatus]|uniref:Uncharacterized protein n=1 Tax=Plakobranchus ocellatus TaxID=259542 RepID=A0AAV4CS54_9GAST|nr:hypothetical protein PoB_006121700 [Plakobranchus ocellatus]